MMANIVLFNNKETKSIELLKEKVTSPALKVQSKNGSIYYGMLFDKKPNYPTLKIENKYLHSIDVQLGSYSIQRTFTGTSSGGNQSSWETVQRLDKHGFINGIKFDYHVKVTRGDYDYITFYANIKNKKDQSKVIKIKKGWGDGDNWTSSQTFTKTFTKEELELLGGPNTEILLETMIDNNRGSSSVTTVSTFTITTY